MTSEQLPPVRVDDELHEEISDFRQKNDLESDSETIRILLQRGLREQKVATFAFLSLVSDNVNDMDELPADYMSKVGESWRDLFMSTVLPEINVIELAGGVESLSKEELAAAYRIQRNEADFHDIVTVLEILMESEFEIGDLEVESEWQV